MKHVKLEREAALGRKYLENLRGEVVRLGGLAGLEGAENLPSLRNLSVFDCTAADLSPLAGCTGLETFSFSGLDGVEDFSALSALPRLHGVLVPQARVEDIAADCPGAAFAITGQ